MSVRLFIAIVGVTFATSCSDEAWLEGAGDPGHAEPNFLNESGAEPETASIVSPIIGATPKKTRKIAALMFDIGGGPPNATNIASTFESVRTMYMEASYGMQDLDVDVLGPWTLPVRACLTIACCGPSSDRTGNGPRVAEIIASLPETYDHYMWVYGNTSGASGCSTWGDAGAPDRPAKYCSIASLGFTGVAQEIGHNLGMEHEHVLECSGGSWADNPSSCSTVEYGSNLSFMARGSGHPHGFHKAHQGWLSGCNVVNTRGSGRFTLLPLERPCNGVQMLQIPVKTRNAPREAVSFYYVELRTPFGRNAATTRQPTVLVYAGPEISSPRIYAEHTFLLEPRMTAAGQSFQDPGGELTITVESISATSATINVTGPAAGSPTCAGGMAFTAPGPGIESCSANTGGTGSGGSAGTGGSAGRGGSAGGTGTAGSGGSSAGASGRGGSGGTSAAGSAGVAGSGAAGAGSGGLAGGGGLAGMAGLGGGASASGGAAGVTGSSGTSGAGGSAAAAGSATAGAPTAAGSGNSLDTDSGCGCRTTRNTPAPAWMLAGLAGLCAARARRRRQRAVAA